MTIAKGRLLTAAAAVRHAEKHGLARDEIAKVTVDGKNVDVDAAEHALKESHAKATAKHAEREAKAEKGPGPFARATQPLVAWGKDHIVDPAVKLYDAYAPDSVKHGVDYTIDKTKELALATPEDIDRRAVVRIVTKSGKSIEIPVVVRDEALSRTLLAISTTTGTVGLFPFFGNFVQAGVGIASLLASCASFVAGDRELARGLAGMGKKHTAMGLIGFVPVFDQATAIQPITDGIRLAQLESGKAGEVVCGAAAIEGALASTQPPSTSSSFGLPMSEIAA
jgi:hypothetical protein